MDFLGSVEDVARTFTVVVAAFLIIWKLVLPHIRKSITGQMESIEQKVDDIHKKTTVNHHSSEEPTILDLLDDVKGLLREHIVDAAQRDVQVDDRLSALERERRVEAGPSVTIRLPRLPFSS